jgi:cytochrome c oxidase subunit II
VYKKIPFIPLAVIGLVISAILIGQALLIEWTPPADSEQAERTFTLLTMLFWSSAVFFVIVTSILIYSIWKWRVKDDDMGDGPPTHGNTTLEVVWTAVPALVLVFAAVYAYIVLDRNEAVAADRVTVDVYAQQFMWTFGYPDAGIETGTLVVPVGKQVQLDMRARDVIHDFWVPEFGIKGDAVPGITHTIWITPKKVGTYPVVCAELCGVGHAVMRTKVNVVPQAQYDAWLAKAKSSVAGTAAATAAATPASGSDEATASRATGTAVESIK